MARELELDLTSRYRDTPLYTTSYTFTRGDVTFFGTLEKPDISLDNASYYTILDTDVGRLDLVSNKYYGTEALWWVIALVNQIIDPLVDMEVGAVIYIPDKSKIFEAFED